MHYAIIHALKEYFERREDVVLAFVFGSQSAGRERPSSDWDIAVYFAPRQWGETETQHIYGAETEVLADVEKIVGTNVDLVVMNHAPRALVFSILNRGTHLIIRDWRLYFTLISQTHYDAVDSWAFAKSYWDIRKKAASLTPEARAIIVGHLTFLKNELEDLSKFSSLSYKEFLEQRDLRRNTERWIENLVMSSLDIAKVILASEKRDMPQTYRELLREFGTTFGTDEFARDFSQCADLRNILTHEYLDLRWERIEAFLRAAPTQFPAFVSIVEDYLEKRVA